MSLPNKLSESSSGESDMPRYSVIYFGTPSFAESPLQTLLSLDFITVKGVVTQPDRPSGRGNKLTPSPIKTLALAHGIPVVQPNNIRTGTSEFLESISEWGTPDIAVVCAFGQILPVKVLDFPRLGSLNIHASLLPRWRGAAPIQRAIMAQDTLTGCCLMKMERGLDTGPIYSRIEVPILSSETSGTLHTKLAQAGSDLLSKTLLQILKEEIKPLPQPEDGVTYAHKIENDEGRINWNQSASSVDALIRGLSPYPGAFTKLGAKRLKIFNSSVKERTTETSAAPGTVLLAQRARLEIACAEGIIELLSLQLEGKKVLSNKEFILSGQISEGQVLG